MESNGCGDRPADGVANCPTGGVDTQTSANPNAEPEVRTDGGQPSGQGGGSPLSQNDRPHPGELLGSLPWVRGALAGVAVALVVLVASFVVGLTLRGGESLSKAIYLVFDLQFAVPHVLPAAVSDLAGGEIPGVAFGPAYLFVPFLLYTAAKFLVGLEGRDAPLEGAAAGATVVVGYLPAMFVFALLGTGPALSNAGIGGPIVIAGLLYPLIAGGLGGLAVTVHSNDERRVGWVYAAGAVFLGVVLTFLTTFLTLSSSSGSFGGAFADSIGMLSRVVIGLITFIGAQAFGLQASGVALLPYLIVAGLAVGFGFLRAHRADVASPLEGFRKAITLSGAYMLSFGLVVALVAIVQIPEVSEELGLGLFAFASMDWGVSVVLSEPGDYLSVLFVAALLHTVVLAGGGGALAGYREQASDTPLGQQSTGQASEQ